MVRPQTQAHQSKPKRPAPGPDKRGFQPETNPKPYPPPPMKGKVESVAKTKSKTAASKIDSPNIDRT